MTLFDANGLEIQQPDIHDPQGVSEVDAQLLACMAAEILALNEEGEPMVIALQPLSAVQLAGLIQLALRHDGVTDTLREIATRFVDSVREYFAESPATLEVLRRGDDPSHDAVSGGA